jgi:endonuclease/exonuclease/phosphatase family metal-dependent hydrolase
MAIRAVLLALTMPACFSSDVPHEVQLASPSMPVESATSLPRQIKIVTFNVHKRDGAAIARAFAHDPQLGDTDLAVLQEVPAEHEACGAACDAARMLGLYAAFEPDFKRGSAVLGEAILSRVPFESSRTISLPDFHAHPNAALVVTLRIADVPITLYGVHLTDQLSLGERVRQMKPILDDAARQPTPTIIAGDFNIPIHFAAHALPLVRGHASRELENMVRGYGFDTPVVWSGPTFRLIPARLDSMYTRGFETTSFGTTHGRDISDHLALWAVMTLKQHA